MTGVVEDDELLHSFSFETRQENTRMLELVFILLELDEEDVADVDPSPIEDEAEGGGTFSFKV